MFTLNQIAAQSPHQLLFSLKDGCAVVITIYRCGRSNRRQLISPLSRRSTVSLLNKSIMKKEFHRMAKAISSQVVDSHYRSDLKKAALARLSVVNRSLKVSKSGAKKRNR